VYVGRDAVTGGERYATRTFRAGRREAERVLEHARRNFSPKTVLETRGYIDRTIRPRLGEVRLGSLRPSLLDPRSFGHLRCGRAADADVVAVRVGQGETRACPTACPERA